MASNLGDRFSTLHEIVRAARHNLAPGPWDYLIGGTETETTLRRNRQALDSIAFRPRVLRDVSKIDTSATLFGRSVRIPVMLAPIGSIETFTEGGGATAAKASGEFGVPQMLSSVCNPGLEAVAKAADNVRIFQLYVRGDDAWVDDWVRRAVDGGYAAFCLTVDTACYSRRERDLARRFVKPWRTRAGGFEFQAVGIGRLACCGLAAAGQPGLERVLELLEDEIKIAMGLLGVSRLDDLDRSYLCPATPVTLPHATSAFPLLHEEGY